MPENVTPLYGADELYSEYEDATNKLAQAYLAWIGNHKYDETAETLLDNWRMAGENFIEAHRKFHHYLEYHREQHRKA